MGPTWGSPGSCRPQMGPVFAPRTLLSWYTFCIKYNTTVYPKKYAHGFCFAVLCCGYTLTDFPISIRLTSLALWQSDDCPSASKATLMNMDKYFIWIHYERLHNHNKAKHNKTVCIFLGIYCIGTIPSLYWHIYIYDKMWYPTTLIDSRMRKCPLIIQSHFFSTKAWNIVRIYVAHYNMPAIIIWSFQWFHFILAMIVISVFEIMCLRDELIPGSLRCMQI